MPDRFLGDSLLPGALLTMDRWAEFDATAAEVWPWIVQLGQDRAGWYAPGWVERFVPASKRAARQVEPRWQDLAVGDDVGDWGPGNPRLRVERLEAPRTLVFSSERERKNGGKPVEFSWALLLTDLEPGRCQLHHRLRLTTGGRVARTIGDRFDQVTIVALFAGLRERLAA